MLGLILIEFANQGVVPSQDFYFVKNTLDNLDFLRDFMIYLFYFHFLYNECY